MTRGVFALALSVLALAVVHGPAAADRSDGDEPPVNKKVAIYSKPSVVRVVAFYEVLFSFGDQQIKEYVGGSGSGFFVSDDGFIATNAHVVQDIQLGEASARKKVLRKISQEVEKKLGASRVGEVMAQVRFVRAKPTAEVILPDGTKLPYTIRAYGAPMGEGDGRDVAIIKVSIKNAPNLVIGDSEKMQVQDRVIAIGYPGAADLAGLLDSKSQLEASITDGSVSAKKRTTDGDPILQVSVPITHGNSGGPAINEKGEVIGLTTFGSKNEVQGFNFLVASATVLKFVKQARANNDPSDTHKLWRKGLDAFWASDFDAALEAFEELKTAYPVHPDVARYIKEARTAKKEGRGKKKETAPAESTAAAGTPALGGGGGDGGAAGVVIAVVLVAGILGVVVFLVARKKPAPQPAGYPAQAQPQQAQYGGPQAPMMVAGRVQQPIAKTVAIGQQQHAPVAATAFGSLTLGSLHCMRGQLLGQRFSLTPTGLLIGRQPGIAQIVINDSRASGKHVWIGYENGVLVAVDQGTTNGTYVNDVRYGRISKAPLKDGDIVIVSEPDCLSLQLKLS
ncbi:MAG: trypsin-like peptidase domain-containing protein [Deltaproteobacteria bacterium]|nr:trypsin-like peptidase domain-containing protein [Deltaproteobacteria bacterium]